MKLGEYVDTNKFSKKIKKDISKKRIYILRLLDDTMWFAAHLNKKESIFENKILNVAYFYDNCEFMQQSGIETDTWSNISENRELPITDIFQYMVKIKDSIAEEPIGVNY